MHKRPVKLLICGLGNPGDKYTGTRHNIGFDVLDKLAKKTDCNFIENRYGQTAQTSHKGRQLFLLKPSTYMNLSGKAVRYHLQSNKIEPENALIITDDVNLPEGKLRLKTKGSSGGHNGLENIIQLLGTSNFSRLRFGVGNDYPKGAQANYVLSPWSADQKEIILPKIDLAVEIILSFVTIGPDKTMSLYNKN